MNQFFILISILGTATSFNAFAAGNSTYSYDSKSGKCLDSTGKEGRNSNVGECGVLVAASSDLVAKGIDGTKAIWTGFGPFDVKDYVPFDHGVLSGSLWTNAKFYNVDYSYSDLTKADFSGVSGVSINLTGVTAHGARFNNLKSYITAATSQYAAIIACSELIKENPDLVRASYSYCNSELWATVYAIVPYTNKSLVLDKGNFVRADFSGANVTRGSIDSAKMHGITGTEAIFQSFTVNNSDLSQIDAQGINFSDSAITMSDFGNSNLAQSSFSNTTVTSVNFANSNMSGTSMYGSTLSNVSFSKVSLPKADFTSTSLSAVVFDGADLSSSNFTQAASAHQGLNRFVNTTLTSAIFTGAKLDHSAFDKSNLQNSDLSGADFSVSTFVSSNLGSTTSLGAKFLDANLSNANLSNSNYTNVDFTGAAMTQVNLKNTGLSSSNVTNADASGSVFASGDLTHANFTSTKLVGADLSGADLRWTNLSQADLSGANLQGVTYNSGTTFTGAIYTATTQLPFDSNQAAQLGMVYQASIGKSKGTHK